MTNYYNAVLKRISRQLPTVTIRSGTQKGSYCAGYLSSFCVLLSLLFLPASAFAVFDNGGFETGDFTGWTINSYLNSSGVTLPVTSRADLNLAAGGTNLSSVLSGATESLSDGMMGSGASLRFPKYESHVALVNYGSRSLEGHGRNVNSMRQTATTTNADVDPADGKVHVRFAIAPVLENPGHAPDEQPYFFVQLTNITKATVLYMTFNFANQAGVPWKTIVMGGRTYQYTDWQAVDIAPGNASLAVGDTVELEVIAAGCELSGHDGHVYVDGIGSFLPGLIASKTGPQQANADTDITYTLTYQNNGSATATNVTVDEVIPANTTFVSVSAPGGTCTTPSVGGTGTVSCNFGTLNPNASGSFQVTVHINAGATGKISNGNYSVYADAITPIIGPLFETTITSATLTDLAVTITDNMPAVGWGQPVTYIIIVTNNGPNVVNGAAVADTMPAQLTGVTWSCVASGGATCTAGGTGNINDIVNLPVGGTATYTVNATVIAGAGTDTLVNTVTVTPPAGVTDSDITNNTAVDTDSIGTLYTLNVIKDPAGTGVGTVVSVPSAINCDTSCPSASAQFVDGTLISLTATAPAHHSFAGWSGGCSGTTNPCTLTISADTTVYARFDAEMHAINTIPGANGSITCTPNPVPYGLPSSCSITPDTGYHIDTTGGTCGGTLSGNTFTTDAITADCTVTASFAINQYQVTATAGTNGSLNAATPSPVTVTYGFTAQFTFDANAGYHIASVIDTCGGAGYSGTSSSVVSYTYTTGTVTSDCSVTAIFAQNADAVAAVPTMTEWGMIIFIMLAGGGSVYYLRRKKSI